METVTVNITRIEEPGKLFCRLSLDLESGDMTCDYSGEVGGGIPMSVYQRRTLRFEIPCLTADAANGLMEEAKPIAQRIIDGASIEWDGNNNVGQLDADADAAADELRALCDPQSGAWADAETVSEWTASDWFTNEPSEQTIERLGLTADTTDEQIASMAAEEEDVARDGTSAGYVILTGAEDYLTDLRSELRDARRNELEEVAQQAAETLERRNVLIRQLDGWGDSSRAIGQRAGLSHVAVQKIAKKTVEE